ncbi:MAG: hypothetical protein AAGB32_00410, partial [Pseudomonadota bacterium]
MSESGNVFLMLFGAVAMVGVLGASTMTLMKGPVKTMSQVTKRTVAENNMMATAKIAVIMASQDPMTNDCDSDGSVEPFEPATSMPAFNGGAEGSGEVPATIGATREDPWGNLYGYCVWDHGSAIDDAACGGATQNRFAGDGVSMVVSDYVVALVSAGPDGTFETTCNDHAGPGTQLTRLGDDIVFGYSYADAATIAGGLWTEEGADTARIGRDLSVRDDINNPATETFGFDASARTLTVGDGTIGIGQFPNINVDVLSAYTAGYIDVNSRIDSDSDIDTTANMTATGDISGANLVAGNAVELAGSDNIILNGNFVSGDGGDEGISIDSDGNVTTSNDLTVGGALDLTDLDVSGDSILGDGVGGDTVTINAGTTVAAGNNVDILGGDLTVTGETTAEQLTVNTLGANITGGVTIATGGLNVAQDGAIITGGASISNGLTVSSGSASITGTLTMFSEAFPGDPGNIDMRGNRVMAIPDVPTALNDAVNANYVTTAVGSVTEDDPAVADSLTNNALCIADSGTTLDCALLGAALDHVVTWDGAQWVSDDVTSLFTESDPQVQNITDNFLCQGDTSGIPSHIDCDIDPSTINANTASRVTDGDNDTYIDPETLATDDDIIRIVTDGTERMRIVNTGEVLIGTSTNDASAIVNIETTTQGLLPPRMTEAQRDLIANPATGLVIYNTDRFGVGNGIFQFNYGTPSVPNWQDIGFGAAGSGLWTDNTTHITRENLHVINSGETSTTAGLDGDGTYSFYDPDSGAFRGGAISGGNDAWQAANIGTQSFAWGQNTEASGFNSTAFGFGTTASNTRSTAFGSNTAASGSGSTAFGSGTIASGLTSTAFGGTTTASNTNSTAFGFETTASGAGSTAFGDATTASGLNSIAFGQDVVAGDGMVGSGFGDNSLAIGLGQSSTATLPQLTGSESMAIFFGDQQGEDITAINVLALEGGSLLLSNDSGTACAAEKQGALRLNAAGDALEICDFAGPANDWRAFTADAGDFVDRIQDDDNNTFIDVDTTDDGLTDVIVFNNNGAESMRIDATGQVGIGVTPTEMLHIQETNAATEPHLFLEHADDQNVVFSMGADRSATDNTIGEIEWEWNGTDIASIRGRTGTDVANKDSGYLLFRTRGAADLNSLDRMILDEDGRVGIGTVTPDASALIDIDTTTAGILGPRMTTLQKNAIVNPATGLYVFDTDTGIYEYNAGTPGAPNWQPLTPAGASVGDRIQDIDVNTFIDVDTSNNGLDNTIVFTNNTAESARFTTDGDLVIGDTAASLTLMLDVAGQVGATEYCDEDGLNCVVAADLNGPFDWDQLVDVMELDATTTIDMDTNTADLNFDGGTLFIDDDGQVGIGTVAPDGSALLELSSTTAGLLLPRMTTIQRDGIGSPAEGLTIYNTTTLTTDYFDGLVWKSFATDAGSALELSDDDGDTLVQVDEGGGDDDTIRFDTDGNEVMTIDPLGAVNMTADLTVGTTLDVTGVTTLVDDLVVDTNTLFVDASGNNVGIGTAAPDASALLDITTTTAGILGPRLSTVQKNAIVNPATGLYVFDTDLNRYQYNAGTPGVPDWQNITPPGAGLWTDNTTHITRENFHIIDTGETSTTAGFNVAGTEVFYAPNKTALRGGTTTSAFYGTDTNIGSDTITWGTNAYASGANSAAFGNQLGAVGDNSFVTGDDNSTTGDGSFVSGNLNTASGNNSATFGDNNVNDGASAGIMGSNNNISATAISAIALGQSHVVQGNGAVSIGNGNQVDGSRAAALATNSNVTGFNAMAFGNEVDIGDGGFGETTDANADSGNYSFGFGLGNPSTATLPRVTSNQTAAFFFDDQESSDVDEENTLALVGGKLMIDAVDNGTDTDYGCIRYNDTSNTLEFADDCDQAVPSWSAFSSGIADDSLDWAQFVDAMELDANTTIDMDTNAATLLFDDTDNLLFLDSVNNFVGINTNTPDVALELGDGTTFNRFDIPIGSAFIGREDDTNNRVHIKFHRGAASTGDSYEFRTTGDGADNATLFQLVADNSFGNPRLSMTADGRFGLGESVVTDASAVLQVNSTTAGILGPRLTTLEKNAITNPATGLDVFDTPLNRYQYNAGTPGVPDWQNITPPGAGLWTDNATHITRENFHILDTGLAAGSTTAGLDGDGTYSFYDPDKGAFRGGRIFGGDDAWEDARVGVNSLAWGRNAEADGDVATSLGIGTVASGDYSVALGSFTTASGQESTAFGNATIAQGDFSTAFGRGNTAAGTYSTAIGREVTATGDYSFGIGLGDASTATLPEITGNETMAIFFGDQQGEDITATNVLALEGGSLLLSNDSGTACSAAKQGALRLAAAGDSLEICDFAGPGDWTALRAVASGTGDRIQDTDNDTSIDVDLNNDGSPDAIVFTNDGTESMRITDMGELLVGHDSIVTLDGTSPHVQFYDDNNPVDFSIGSSNDTPTTKADVDFFRSRGTAIAPTAVQANDPIGSIRWYGYDGDTYEYRAGIVPVIDGAVSDEVVPTAITFTSSDNTTRADSSERMRLTSAGDLVIGDTAASLTLMLDVAGQVGATEYCDEDGLNCTPGGSLGGLWTDNTTHITRENFHVIDTGSNSTAAGLDGAGTRAFYDPNKGAFRGGEINNSFTFDDAWEDANIGLNTFAYGLNIQASGNYSFASGFSSVASGNFSSVLGINSTASGVSSSAIGSSAVASGNNSTAMGATTQASGFNATAFGREVQVGTGVAQTNDATADVGNYSVGFGLGNASTATLPRVTSNQTAAFFFGDQESSDVDEEDTLALVGGKLMIDQVDNGTDTDYGCIRYNDTSNQLEFADDCDQGSPSWSAFSSGIANDSLDWAQFVDAMELDANTTIDMDTNAATLLFDNTDNLLFLDSVNNRVGIGTITPDVRLTISENAGALSTLTGSAATGTVLRLAAADGSATRAIIDGYGNGANLSLRAANGTAVTPTALTMGDRIGTISFFGYGATDYSSGTNSSIFAEAAENMTDSARGTNLNFQTTSIGTTSNQTRMTISESGRIGIGTATPDASALIDMTSITAGMLPPRMSSGDRDNINTGTFADGLMI